MQPPQPLDQIPHALHRRQPPAHHLLLLLAQIQEALDELPVHEPVRLLRLALRVVERAVREERDVPGGLDVLGQALLQAQQQVLRRGRDAAVQEEGALRLSGVSG